MLRVSEFPRGAVAFSWSAVLDANPPLSCYLMPSQWTMYLERLQRAKKAGKRLDGLPALYWPSRRPASSLLVVRLLSLTLDEGIRWLSGPESLALQGFAPDWMRPTTRRLGLLETPSPYRSRGG
jgi:hypothetical protein